MLLTTFFLFIFVNNFFEELKDILPDLSPTANSGAKHGDGDFATKDLVVEVKASEGQDLPKVSKDDWIKTDRAAAALRKDFIVAICNKDRSVAGVLFPMHLAKLALRLICRSETTDCSYCGCSLTIEVCPCGNKGP